MHVIFGTLEFLKCFTRRNSIVFLALHFNNETLPLKISLNKFFTFSIRYCNTTTSGRRVDFQRSRTFYENFESVRRQSVRRRETKTGHFQHLPSYEVAAGALIVLWSKSDC